MRKKTAVRSKLRTHVHGWLGFAVLGLLMVACTNPSSSQTSGTDAPADTNANKVVAIDSPDTDLPEKEFAPGLPPKKPEAELAALRKYWKSALEAERKLLVSPRLEEWLATLQDSVDQDGFPIRRSLRMDQFMSLTTKERMAYKMFHPEEYLQNCGEYAAAEGLIQAISRNLPYDETGYFWSERQMSALVKDSNEVKKAVVECLKTQNAASIPLLHLIAEMKIREAIPQLVVIYRSQAVKDDLILTTLMEIMERSNYWKWIYSPTCKTLVISDHEILPLEPSYVDSVLTFAQRFAER